MSTLSFPSAPSLNDVYSFDGKTWIWNGSAWDLQDQGAINGIVIGNVSPNTGAFTQVTITSQGELKFNDGDNSNYVAFRSSMNVAGNVTWTLPDEDGSAGQVLATDGAGVLTWVTAAAGSGESIFGTGGTMGLVTQSPTDTEDLGLVTGLVTESYDLGSLGVDGIVTNDNIVDGTITGNKLAPNIDIATTGNLSVGNFTGPAGNIEISANLIPTANVTYDLGSTANRWNDLWLANSTIYIGDVQISATGSTLELPATVKIGTVTLSETGGNLDLPENISANTITATGNITGEYILGNGSQLTGVAASGGVSDTGIFLNSQFINANVTISNVYNGFSVGPLTQANGVVVTQAAGSRWVIL